MKISTIFKFGLAFGAGAAFGLVSSAKLAGKALAEIVVLSFNEALSLDIRKEGVALAGRIFNVNPGDCVEAYEKAVSEAEDREKTEDPDCVPEEKEAEVINFAAKKEEESDV